MNKQRAYRQLVQKRQKCRLCQELTNPSSIDSGRYELGHIGPWTTWQGNLDAKLMVIGQDWGVKRIFVETKGLEPFSGNYKIYRKNNTNETLRKLLTSVDIDIELPEGKVTTGVIFLTNAILCFKPGEDLQSKVKLEWYYNCGPQFLKPLIDIVEPRVVVTLGEYAFKTLKHTYNLFTPKFNDAVTQYTGISLSKDSIYLPMYHPSPRILNTHRPMHMQLKDWQRVKSYM